MPLLVPMIVIKSLLLVSTSMGTLHACVTLAIQGLAQMAHVKVHTSKYMCLSLYVMSWSIDVNECYDVSLSGCDGNAECLNNVGSFECQCSPGYLGDGFICSKTVPAHEPLQY